AAPPRRGPRNRPAPARPPSCPAGRVPPRIFPAGGEGDSPNGIAVSKKLPQLSDAIQKALQALIDDGTVTKIFDKYGVASIAVKEATKNAAVD
ncbi:hypothetical protein ACWDA9_41935, partial [Streptomyces sp. NPDC001193]